MTIDPIQLAIGIATLLAIPTVGYFLKRQIGAQDAIEKERYELLAAQVAKDFHRVEERILELERDIKLIRLEYVRREDFAAHIIGANRRAERLEHKVDRILAQLGDTPGASPSSKQEPHAS